MGALPLILRRSRLVGCIAQLVEQLTLNQRVQGSSPCAPTNNSNHLGEGNSRAPLYRLLPSGGKVAPPLFHGELVDQHVKEQPHLGA